MQNPWQSLPKDSPYVLDRDRPAIEAFNANAQSAHEIRLELLPEPFLGNVHAPVLVLALNPGFSSKDEAFYAECAQVARDNLLHAVRDYPFYLLDPALAGIQGRNGGGANFGGGSQTAGWSRLLPGSAASSSFRITPGGSAQGSYRLSRSNTASTSSARQSSAMP